MPGCGFRVLNLRVLITLYIFVNCVYISALKRECLHYIELKATAKVQAHCFSRNESDIITENHQTALLDGGACSALSVSLTQEVAH